MTSGDCGKDQAGNPTSTSKTSQPTPRRKGSCLRAVKPRIASCILSGLGGRSEVEMERTERHRRPGEELRAVDIKSEPRGVLCAVAPRNQMEE